MSKMISRKQRKQAEELLRTAQKVGHYRGDLFSDAVREALDGAKKDLLDVLRKDPAATEDAFDKAAQRMDRLLREHGGTFYPRTFLGENVEVLLVAALIVIGVRTFFLQPFIIPTNSMFPSYSGMQAEVYAAEEVPGFLKQAFLKFQKFGRLTKLEAPASGEVRIPLFSQDRRSPDRGLASTGLVRYEQVPARRFFVLPTTQRRYTLFVGETPVSFNVPMDFSADEVIIDTFFPEGIPSQGENRTLDSARPLLSTGTTVEEGEPLLAFNLFLGDALFVDRMSFHFRQPRVGDPIVFRTGDISGISGDQYYIKRLAGVGGETLEIRDYQLLVDGRLRDENRAFVKNAERTDGFPGYRNIGSTFREGSEVFIPEGTYIALGDNSANSLDSRQWGTVPEGAVVGRAFFIYYPFTTRWGLAN